MSETELIRGTNEDDISTTDTRGAKMSSESVMMKAQFVGLGSVLIATVTFAAAFTLPGGTNQDTGAPILGRKYIFKAFVIADYFAFFQSFMSTMNIIHGSCAGHSDMMERCVDVSLNQFTTAARSMFIARGLGLYLLLAPNENTGAIVLAFSLFFATLFRNQYDFMSQWNGIRLERQLLRHIPDGDSGVKLKSIISARERFRLTFHILGPIIGTSIVIFLFALI